MSLPRVPPYYGEGDAGWAAMFAPVTRGEDALSKRLSGERLAVARAWRAYAVQGVVGTLTDGVWGDKTDMAVRGWQRHHGLLVDAIVGPKTQLAMLVFSAATVEQSLPAIPRGVLKGYITYEGAGILAAVNWYTPPNGTPGVDCGAAQWRQYGPPFGQSGLLSAFDAKSALRYSATILITRMRDFRARRPSLSARQALDLGVLAHNAPFLSDQVVRNGRLSTPDALAVWTRKADGSHYTHAEWSAVYPAKMLSFADLSSL